MIEITTIYRGRQFNVCALVVEKHCLAQEFVDELQELDQKKIFALLKYAGDNGPPRNLEKFRKLENDIWEFKSFRVRLLCFFDKKQLIILTHGFMKKSRKTPPAEIDKAKRLKKEYFLERKRR